MDGTGVLQQLWDDHRVSAHLLAILERSLPGALDGDTQALRAIHDIVAREREYGDRVHHAREELLFARLASRDAAGADAVQGLAHDHNELARMGGTLLESLAARIAGRPEDADLLRQRATLYVDALRNHMHKEEHRVFPLAERLLHEEDWLAVADAFRNAPDPLQPPVSAAWKDLETWLARNGGSPFAQPGPGG